MKVKNEMHLYIIHYSKVWGQLKKIIIHHLIQQHFKKLFLVVHNTKITYVYFT